MSEDDPDEEEGERRTEPSDPAVFPPIPWKPPSRSPVVVPIPRGLLPANIDKRQQYLLYVGSVGRTPYVMFHGLDSDRVTLSYRSQLSLYRSVHRSLRFWERRQPYNMIVLYETAENSPVAQSLSRETNALFFRWAVSGRLPRKLKKRLRAEALGHFSEVLGDIETQLSGRSRWSGAVHGSTLSQDK